MGLWHPSPQGGGMWREAEPLLSLGSIGCLFRDHPADCWPGASQAPGHSVRVPGAS